MPDDSRPAEAVIDRLEASAEVGRTTSVEGVRDELGHMGSAPFLVVPALIGASPLGGIPVLPTLMAVIVVVVAAQIAAGRDGFWLPEKLARLHMESGRLESGLQALRPPARWADTLFRRRMCWLCGAVPNRIAAGVSMLLALCVPPLELVPFAAALPFGAIALFGFAMLLRDGLVMALAFALSAVAACYVPVLLPFA